MVGNGVGEGVDEEVVRMRFNVCFVFCLLFAGFNKVVFDAEVDRCSLTFVNCMKATEESALEFSTHVVVLVAKQHAQ